MNIVQFSYFQSYRKVSLYFLNFVQLAARLKTLEFQSTAVSIGDCNDLNSVLSPHVSCTNILHTGFTETHTTNVL